jgi:hypothetical protein
LHRLLCRGVPEANVLICDGYRVRPPATQLPAPTLPGESAEASLRRTQSASPHDTPIASPISTVVPNAAESNEDTVAAALIPSASLSAAAAVPVSREDG